MSQAGVGGPAPSMRPALRRSLSTASMQMTGSMAQSAQITRTSPRLDASAAFFSGIPSHAPTVSASYSADSQGLSFKRSLLTASHQGELVHWAHIPGVGYEARALLVPPTTHVCSATSVPSDGHRRSHWMPAIPGASLIASSSCPAPQLSRVTCLLSCRVASKEVYVTGDTAGHVSQWSIDGDCCYCSARLCPFPITLMRVFVVDAPQVDGTVASHTYAICASNGSHHVFIIDLLQMHVIRCIDISPPENTRLRTSISEEEQDYRDEDSPEWNAAHGIAAMDVRLVPGQGRCDSHELFILTSLGHVSVWDLTSVVHTTLQFSSDSAAAFSTPDGASSNPLASPSGATLRRQRAASMSSSFFASLPPMDCSQSPCLSAPEHALSCIASDIVSMSSYTAPAPLDGASSPPGFVLIVMTRHWIVLDASTLAPIIPLQSMAEDCDAKEPVSLHSHTPSLRSSPVTTAFSSLSVPLPPLPPVPPLPPSNSPPSNSVSPLPLPPSPSSRRPSISGAPSIVLPPASLPPLPINPSPTHAQPSTNSLHQHTDGCTLVGGSFLYSTASPADALARPGVLLWSSCGNVWLASITDSAHSLTAPPSSALSLDRKHSTPAPTTHGASDTGAPHTPPAVARTVAVFKQPPFAPPLSAPSFVHVPSTSGDICASDSASFTISVIVGWSQGQLVEYGVPINWHRRPATQLIEPRFTTRFTDAFATPTYLHQFQPTAPPVQSTALSAALVPSPSSTCSAMLFDLVSHTDSGMSSLMIMLAKGFESGRIEFFKILTSATPRGHAKKATTRAAEYMPTSDSYHTIQGHTAAVTALVVFQSHESIIALPLIVTASLDCSVAVWDGRGATLIFRLQTPSPVLDLTRPTLPPTPQAAPDVGVAAARINVNVSCIDSELVCVICADYSVRLFSIARMGWTQVLRGHDSLPRSVFRDEWALLNDLALVLTERGTIHVWSLSTGQLEEVLEGGDMDGAAEMLQRLPIYGGGNAAPRTMFKPRTPSFNSPRHQRALSSSLSPNMSPKLSPAPSSPLGVSRRSLSTSSPLRSSSIAHGNGVAPDAMTTISLHAPLSGISEGSNDDPSTSPIPCPSPSARHKTSSSSLTPSRSSPPTHASALSTAALGTSPHDELLTPPRLNRSVTAPNARLYDVTNRSVGRGGIHVSLPSPSTSFGASSLPGMKTASWAVHYGLQRLWKLGGKGGLWTTPPDESTPSSSTSDGAGALASAASSSNLICSFESLPSLHLNLFSIDIGYFAAEIKHAYAPLDASSDITIAHAAANISTETMQRSEVYKEILKLIVDWDDDAPPLDDTSVPLTNRADVLDILRSRFHMRSPQTSRGDQPGGSLSALYASYSPTNNALTILLPRTCSTKATRDMVSPCVPRAPAQMSHLSRWAIGPNFSASQSLCLTTVLLALLGSSDIQLHNSYSLIEAYYNATLPSIPGPSLDPSALALWKYTEADIPFLSSYALHEHEDIRRGSRLLIQGIIGRMDLQEIWSTSREWSSFYEGMGTAAPPPLPWSEHVPATAGVPCFPVAPRYVSDFEFMACMLLCYLAQAQARRMREDATGAKSTMGTPPSAKARHLPSLSRTLLNPTTDLALDNEFKEKRDAESSTTESEPSQSIISLDASMFGGMSGLKVEPSPKHHRTASSTRTDEDESKQDAESTRGFATSPTPPIDKTPWIISTLLRLLSQTHQDASLHSIQKSSICVELLIQGLSQARAPSATSQPRTSPSAASKPAVDENESNLFWKYIPVSALEPLYRIIFDLSFVPPSPLPAAATFPSHLPEPPAASGRRGSLDPSRSQPAAVNPLIAFANSCRVLLFELAKFDVAHFIEFVRKELFGYNTTAAATQPSTVASASNVTAPSAAAASPPALSLASSGCASFKSLHFDEYRFQLVSVLALFPKKFAMRMNYGVLKCMVDLLIRVLDPLMISQNAAGALVTQAQAAHANSSAGGGGLTLRGRFLALLYPLFHFLAARYSWISFSSTTMKLSVVENLKWIYYERCALGFYKPRSADEADATRPRSGVDTTSQQQQQYLLHQPPIIQIYDLQTALKWRTLEGHAAGSEIDCIAFSQNGHLLASYCSTDSPQATIRVWSTDYESSSVGSGFLPTRLLMRAVFKVNPFCTQVLELPAVPAQVTRDMMEKRRKSMLSLHGRIGRSGIHWQHADAITITREDDTVLTLKL